MNNKRLRKKLGFAFATWGLATLLVGCDDGPPRSAVAPPAPAPKTAPRTVTESDHQIFEKKYAEKCIKSQQQNVDSQLQDDQELTKVCQCMAKDISKRLSKADAIHFNEKNEFPFDLVMMTDAAANHCMTPPK